MTEITETTRWDQMQIGDKFVIPDPGLLGGERHELIIDISSKPSRVNPERDVVTVTAGVVDAFSCSGIRLHTYSDNWADETWGETVERGRYMSSLPDNS